MENNKNWATSPSSGKIRLADENVKIKNKKDSGVTPVSGDWKQMDEMKKMLNENLALTEDIHKMTKKINNFVIMSRVFTFIKVLIILIPLLIGIFYLPPIVKNMIPKVKSVIEQYKELLGLNQGINNLGEKGTVNLGDIDVDQMSPELRKLLER